MSNPDMSHRRFGKSCFLRIFSFHFNQVRQRELLNVADIDMRMAHDTLGTGITEARNTDWVI